jgi:hypothetical protein
MRRYRLRHVADRLWFPAVGSSTENVMGGRKLALHVFRHSIYL